MSKSTQDALEVTKLYMQGHYGKRNRFSQDEQLPLISASDFAKVLADGWIDFRCSDGGFTELIEADSPRSWLVKAAMEIDIQPYERDAEVWVEFLADGMPAKFEQFIASTYPYLVYWAQDDDTLVFDLCYLDYLFTEGNDGETAEGIRRAVRNGTVEVVISPSDEDVEVGGVWRYELASGDTVQMFPHGLGGEWWVSVDAELLQPPLFAFYSRDGLLCLEPDGEQTFTYAGQGLPIEVF